MMKLTPARERQKLRVLRGRQQPAEVERDAFEDGAGQVRLAAADRHVVEPAAGRAVVDGAAFAGEPGGEQHAVRAGG